MHYRGDDDDDDDAMMMMMMMMMMMLWWWWYSNDDGGDDDDYDDAMMMMVMMMMTTTTMVNHQQGLSLKMGLSIRPSASDWGTLRLLSLVIGNGRSPDWMRCFPTITINSVPYCNPIHQAYNHGTCAIPFNTMPYITGWWFQLIWKNITQ